MTPKVELIYDRDCPNVEAARQQLRRAFEQLGQCVKWDEWDRSDPSSPDHARHYGSPTILIDGKDVFGASPLEGADCCRVYHSQNDGFGGVPPVEAITTALRNSGTTSNNRCLDVEHMAEAKEDAILLGTCRGRSSLMNPDFPAGNFRSG